MLEHLSNKSETFVSGKINTIDTAIYDTIEKLFEAELITKEQWQLVKDLRQLAYRARRSQGVRVHLQSHSQYWGMPPISGSDGYENKRAERKWKLFLLYAKPFIEQQWLNQNVFNLIVHGGATIESEKNNKRIVNLPFTAAQLDHVFQIIKYVYEKAYRRK
ncbi:MAG: hypothetical protein Q8S21_03960 [Candidatus Paracaedibacteraceae bacterium]|nr:hypothetical protein [Candidatus Paracaedibacteraceae bacterium]